MTDNDDGPGGAEEGAADAAIPARLQASHDAVADSAETALTLDLQPDLAVRLARLAHYSDLSREETARRLLEIGINDEEQMLQVEATSYILEKESWHTMPADALLDALKDES